MEGTHCSKNPLLIHRVHSPRPEIDLENEPTYSRLRMLSSFCNAETGNSTAKKKKNKKKTNRG